MTYGRPSMTSHVSPIYRVPLPAMRPELQTDDPCHLSGQACDHKLGSMTFYVSTIELYGILESILSDVYNAWQSRSNHRFMSLQGTSQGSLDIIMELDDRLSTYECNVPTVLNWICPQQPNNTNDHQNSVFQRQQNVLRARYLLFFPGEDSRSLQTDSSTSVSSCIDQCSHSSARKSAQAQLDNPTLQPSRLAWKETLFTLPCR